MQCWQESRVQSEAPLIHAICAQMCCIIWKMVPSQIQRWSGQCDLNAFTPGISKHFLLPRSHVNDRCKQGERIQIFREHAFSVALRFPDIYSNIVPRRDYSGDFSGDEMENTCPNHKQKGWGPWFQPADLPEVRINATFGDWLLLLLFLVLKECEFIFKFGYGEGNAAWRTSYFTTKVNNTKPAGLWESEREEKKLTKREWGLLKKCPIYSPEPPASDPPHPAVWSERSEKGPQVFSDGSSPRTMKAVCLVFRCRLGVGQRACHLRCLSCKQLTHHDEWKVCRERGSRSGLVGVMIRDREVEGELRLGLSMLRRCLIEGCFNAVGGWQVGIIIAICLRSRHPDWLLMAAACAGLLSTRVNLAFH